MSSRNDIERDANLSEVMQKMKNTLEALSAAFDEAMGLQDPMSRTQHEVWKVTKINSKKPEFVDS